MFCAECYVEMGGATSLCPTCKNVRQSIRIRGFEMLRDKYLARLKKIRTAAEARTHELEDEDTGGAANKTSAASTGYIGDAAVAAVAFTAQK